MASFRSLQRDIHCLDAHYIRDQFAAFYLLREKDEVAIIETGTNHSIGNLRQTMDRLGIDAAQVKYVIPTHIHLDHAGGAGQMMALFDQATLVIHPRGARHMIDPAKLIEGSIAVYGEQRFHELYGEIRAIDEARVRIAEDEDSISLHQRELLFIDTPGHARHHFCIYDEASRGIFSGDTFGSAYPRLKTIERGLIPTTTPVHFDPPALIASIDRLLGFQPQWMYLTHYGELADPVKHGDSLKAWINEFVEICESIDPGPEDSEQTLRDALAQALYRTLQKDLDAAEVEDLLGVDISLNAQGILHWWRHSGRA